MTVIGRIFRLMFGATGPQREAANDIEQRLAKADIDNKAAVSRNLRSVQGLIEDTLNLVNDNERD